MRRGLWQVREVRPAARTTGAWDFYLRKVGSGHMLIQTVAAATVERAFALLKERFEIAP